MMSAVAIVATSIAVVLLVAAEVGLSVFPCFLHTLPLDASVESRADPRL